MKKVLCSGLVVLAGCVPTIDNHGYDPDRLDIKKIHVGVDTKQTIQEKLGSPSTVAPFGKEGEPEGWYYISKKTENMSFFEPKTLDQRTIVIAFTRQGIVRDIVEYTGEHPVVPLDKKTETTGYESSVMRDIFGNFGRYSTPKSR